MKRKIYSLIIVFILISVIFIIGSGYVSLSTKPDWYKYLPDDQKEIYNDWERLTHQTFYTVGPDPRLDPSSSFLLPVEPLTWWQGHGCVPTAIGMELLYYDTYYNTSFLGEKYTSPYDDIPIQYEYLATDSHMDNCFSDDFFDDHGDSESHCGSLSMYSWTCEDCNLCCDRPDECLADFMNTCDGGTVTRYHLEDGITGEIDFTWMNGRYDECSNKHKGGVVRYFDYVNEDVILPYTRYWDTNDWWNEQNDQPGQFCNNPELGHYFQKVDYELIKSLINQGIPVIMETNSHAICAVGWNDDLSYYDSPQILIYNGWGKSLVYLEIDEQGRYDEWKIDNVYYFYPEGVDLSDFPDEIENPPPDWSDSITPGSIFLSLFISISAIIILFVVFYLFPSVPRYILSIGKLKLITIIVLITFIIFILYYIGVI